MLWPGFAVRDPKLENLDVGHPFRGGFRRRAAVVGLLGLVEVP